MKPILSLISPEDMNFPLNSSTVMQEHENYFLLSVHVLSPLTTPPLTPTTPSLPFISSHVSPFPLLPLCCLSLHLFCDVGPLSSSTVFLHFTCHSFLSIYFFRLCFVSSFVTQGLSVRTHFFPTIFPAFLSFFVHRACRLSSLSPPRSWYKI